MAYLVKLLRWLALPALLLLLGLGNGPVQAEAGPIPAAHVLAFDDRMYRAAAEGRFAMVVQVFPWRDIEPTRDEWHWEQPDFAVQAADFYGLGLIVRLDHQPDWAAVPPDGTRKPPVDLDAYGEFAATVALRYRGRVGAYIVWNEPNLSREWGGGPPDPEAYTALLCRTHAALKAADPSALVVSAGLAPTNGDNGRAMDDRLFLRRMYEAGAGDCFDALGVHAYGFGHPPDDRHEAHDGLNLARTLDLREIMVANGDGARPVWITELGWTTDGAGADSWQTVSSEQQADYLMRAWQYIGSQWPWAELMTVWNLSRDLPARDEMSGYSLLNHDGSPKPAYHALAKLFAESGDDGAGNGLGLKTKPGKHDADSEISIVAADEVIHLGDNQ